MRFTDRAKCQLLTAVVFGLASPLAQAVPVTWFLKDVVFADGGTASGSFVFDADLGSTITFNVGGVPVTAPGGNFLALNITTTTGTSLSGNTYFDPNPASPGNFAFMNTVPDDSLLDFLGTPKMVAELLAPMTNAGGTVAINITGFSGEGTCNSTTCGSTLLARRFVSGQFTTTSVPEPTTTALLTLGLLGAGFAKKRRSHIALGQ